MAPNLPSLAGCYAILHEYEVPGNILQHTEAVARVTRFLATRLAAAGIPINVELAERGALLHDLDKLLKLAPGQWHGELGGRILRERGYPELGQVIARHAIGVAGNDGFPGWTWEERLVHYADKLCMEADLVLLQQRLARLRARYPEQAAVIDLYEPDEEALEQAILTPLRLDGDSLLAELKREPC